MTLSLQSHDQTFTESGTYSGYVDFGNTINAGDIALKAIESKYSGTDHHVSSFVFKIYNVNIDTNGTRLNFSLQYEQKDVHGSSTSGNITILAIADIEAKTQQKPSFTITKDN